MRKKEVPPDRGPTPENVAPPVPEIAPVPVPEDGHAHSPLAAHLNVPPAVDLDRIRAHRPSDHTLRRANRRRRRSKRTYRQVSPTRYQQARSLHAELKVTEDSCDTERTTIRDQQLG